MSRLQTESASPLYQQIIQRIREDMDRGVYPVGSRIPPEHELEKHYQVSRVTVRRALSDLTRMGLLERKQGKGTFVSQPRDMRNLKNVHSFHDSCVQNGVTPGTRVVHVREVPADERDRIGLKLGREDRVVEILRVRLADGVPVVLEQNRFTMAYAYLEEQDLRGSLYQVLRDFGVEPKQGTHEISLCTAGEREAELLAVPEGTPLLLLDEVIFDGRGRPLHTSRQWIRGDRFVFRI